MDHSTGFINSLRSSGGEGGTPNRRASLSVSSWYTPPGGKSASKAKLLRKASESPHQPGNASEKSNISPLPAKGGANATENPSYPGYRRNEIWEPPISCQKRVLASSNYQTYFPLELTDRDYYHRLLSLAILGLEEVDYNKLTEKLKGRELSDFPEPMEEFANLIIANSSSRKAESTMQKMHALFNLSEEYARALVQTAEAFLMAKESFAAHLSGWSKSRLGGLVENLFALTKTLLSKIRDYSFGVVVSTSISIVQKNTTNDQLQHEVKELLNQFKLHQHFQAQRMTALGWQWSSSDVAFGGGAQSNPLKERGFMFALSTGADADSHGGDPLSRWKVLEADLAQFLQPATVAKLLFSARLHHLIYDLANTAKRTSELGDYPEAQRLRDLAEIVESTLDEDCHIIFEDAKAAHHQLKVLSSDFQRHIFQLKQNHDVQALPEAESSLKHIITLSKKLNGCVSPPPFLTHESLQRDIDTHGTDIITSDYLYTTPHPSDNLSLGGLLAKTSSLVLIDRVKGWPGLTVLPRQGGNNSSCSNPEKGQDHQYGEEDKQDDESVEVLMSPYADRHFFPGSPTSAKQTAWGERDFSSSNSPSHNRTATLTGGLSPQRSSGGGLLARPSSQQMMLNALMHSSTNPLTASLSPNHNQSNQSMMRQSTQQTISSKQNFARFIFDTLRAFEELLGQLDALLSPAASAYTELMTRLVGMQVNLSSLSEMNRQVGQLSETARLQQLQEAIEDTLTTDADLSQHGEDDPGKIGRGRHRVDNIWQLCAQVQQGLEELSKLRAKARSVSDYTAAAALDSMHQRLSTAVALVTATMHPFSLLDSENDIMGSEAADINERIAREGTEFFTADYLFAYASGPRGHSLGSLAIVAGAGIVLRSIKQQWPGLTALGNLNHELTDETTSAAASNNIAGGLNSNNGNNNTGGGGQDGDANMSIAAALISDTTVPISAMTVGVGGGIGGGNSRRRSSLFSAFAGYVPAVNLMSPPGASSGATAGSGVGGSGGNAGGVTPQVDFRDAHAMRLLGFDARTLQCAGFKDLDILTAGFTAEQLKVAGFDAQRVHAAMGLTAQAVHALGFGLQHQLATLSDLYLATEGTQWRQQQHWSSIAQELKSAASNKLDQPSHYQLSDFTGSGSSSKHQTSANQMLSTTVSQQGTRLQQQQRLQQLLAKLAGVEFNTQILEVTRLSLVQNNLRGSLPASLSALISLKTLDLSGNHLCGSIPASLGLLVHLEVLNLDQNDLSGEIPKTLKNLHNLRILRLSRNQLTGTLPTTLAALTHLRRLDVSHNQLTGPLPQRFGRALVHLQELLLHHNAFSGDIPPSWVHLQALTHLELQCNQLSGYLPEHVYLWQRLTGLQLQENAALIVDRLQLQRALPKCRIKL